MRNVLTIALAIALLVACIFLYQSCGDSNKIATLTTSETALKADKATLTGKVKTLEGDLTKANGELTTWQEKNAELITGFDEELAKIIKVAKDAKDRMTWWFNQAEKVKKELEAEQKVAKDKFKALAKERDGLKGAKEKALSEKEATVKELAGVIAKADAQEAEEVKKAVALLEERIKGFTEKVRQLEAKIAERDAEIEGLKSRVLSTGEKAEKKKAAADSFRVYITSTAVNPDTSLKAEIRALAAEILPKMFSISDDELYKIAEPIMERMPQQDEVRSVRLLHAAWARWKEARRLYSRSRLFKRPKVPMPEESKRAQERWSRIKGKASS